MKGKPTRKKPLVATNDYATVPKAMQEKHKDLVSSGDACFIQGLAFLITLSQNIIFTTTQFLEDCKVAMMVTSFDQTW